MLTKTQAQAQNEKKRIVKGYVRVSTNMQKEDGVSLETQTKMIQEYCNYKKLELVKIYEDAGLSGKNITGRPDIQELLSSIQKGETVIVCTLSRLGRDVRDVLKMVDLITSRGGYLVILDMDIDTATPIGEAVLIIMAALNQLERKNTSKNVSLNMKRLVQEGKLRGKSPFGYKFIGKDKDFEPVPEQQEVVKIILELFAFGVNMNKISKKLNDEGRGPTLNLNKKTPTANPKFYPETVKTILQNHGAIESDSKPVDQRIVSFHKAT